MHEQAVSLLEIDCGPCLLHQRLFIIKRGKHLGSGNIGFIRCKNDCNTSSEKSVETLLGFFVFLFLEP